MTFTTIIGLTAAVLTTVSFVPQALKTIRTKNVDGLSVGMYSIFTLGIVCWLTYGIVMKDLPMILANSITIIFVLIILIYVIKYGSHNNKN